MEIKSGDRVQFDANERRLLKGFIGDTTKTAEQLGMTRQNLSRVMNGHQTVTWERAAAIVQFLVVETAGLDMGKYPARWRSFYELYGNAQQGKALYTSLRQRYGADEAKRLYNEAWEPAAKMNDESPEQK